MSRTVLKPRPYQEEALASLTGKERELIVLPTGGGKTVVFAHKGSRYVKANKGFRFIVLVHTDELVAQAYEKIKKVAPHLNIGIVKGTRRDIYADGIVASVQTLRNDKVLRSITCVGLIIVDEANHALAASYIKIMTHFGCFRGECETVGFTATPMRGDGKSLFPTWQKVAFQRDISWMVRKRYLVPPKGKAVQVPDLDLRKVKASKADYREGELGEALAESLAPELVVKAWQEHAAGRKTLGFAPTVASAEVFAEAFREQGVPAEVIHGGMPLGSEHNPEPGTRRRVLQDHRAGKFLVLWNCMILTEGYDDPEVSCIIVGRPTKSKGLYIQIVGRGLRVDESLPYEGQDCLILDVVGAAGIHGDLRSLADLSERPLKEEDAHSGRSIVDLEDEFDAGEGVEPDEPLIYLGPVEVVDFDPMGRPTTSVWLKTKGGTFFVPSGMTAYVFIMQYPEPGQWSVCWCTKEPSGRRYECGTGEEGVPRPVCTCGKKCSGRPVGMTIHRGLPLDQAMVWAEDLAVDMGTDLNTAKKTAAWRKKPTSPKLINYAKGLGVKMTPLDESLGVAMGVKERMGEISDKVSIINGTRRIDPIVQAVHRKMSA
jgi:superfamily II DNA or RNA helicase